MLTGNYLTSCLMQCLNIREGPAELLLTAGTDGHIAFWNFAGALAYAHESEVTPSEIRPLQRFKVHQNTIHCVTLHWHNDQDCLLVTGGDDSSIGITRCTWSATADGLAQVSTTLFPTTIYSNCSRSTRWSFHVRIQLLLPDWRSSILPTTTQSLS